VIGGILINQVLILFICALTNLITIQLSNFKVADLMDEIGDGSFGRGAELSDCGDSDSEEDDGPIGMGGQGPRGRGCQDRWKRGGGGGRDNRRGGRDNRNIQGLRCAWGDDGADDRGGRGGGGGGLRVRNDTSNVVYSVLFCKACSLIS
jgi:hypothetical protein